MQRQQDDDNDDYSDESQDDNPQRAVSLGDHQTGVQLVERILRIKELNKLKGVFVEKLPPVHHHTVPLQDEGVPPNGQGQVRVPVDPFAELVFAQSQRRSQTRATFPFLSGTAGAPTPRYVDGMSLRRSQAPEQTARPPHVNVF